MHLSLSSLPEIGRDSGIQWRTGKRGDVEEKSGSLGEGVGDVGGVGQCIVHRHARQQQAPCVTSCLQQAGA